MRKQLYQIAKKCAILWYRLLCLILPVKKRRVVFGASLGKSYAGNPKYIYEYLEKNGFDREMEIIWLYEKMPYEIPGMCKQAKYRGMKYLYYMATAQVWVFDNRQPEFLIRRKHTYYIQTWHGTPLKKLGLDMDDVFMDGETDIEDYKKNFIHNTHTWDYLICQNEYSAEIFQRAFDFHKELLRIGYPRNDVLFGETSKEMQKKQKRKLGLPEDKKVILYAPTWRDDEYSGNQKYSFRPQISFEALGEALGDEYVMIVKYHYLIMDAVDFTPYEGFIYHFDQSTDISELYLASDLLVTDYSSVMFDYSILRRPMFFYAYDLEKYKNKLRGFYFDFESEMPGPISETTKDLIRDIQQYEKAKYEEKYRRFCEKFNTFDDGTASEKTAKLIINLIEKKER